MQRDKRGRFVKKAYTGTTLGVPSLNTTVNFNGTAGLNTGFVGTGSMNGTSAIGETIDNLDFTEYLEAKKLNPTLQYNQWLLTKNKLKTPAVTNGASVETEASDVTTSLNTDQDSTTTNTTTGRIPTKSDIANMHSELEALFGKSIPNPAAIKPVEYKTPFELEAERKQAYMNARQYSLLYGNKANWNNIWAPNQILYTEKPDGTKIDQFGREISTQEFFSNPGIYKKDIKPMTFPEVKVEGGGSDEESDRINFFNEKEGFGSKLASALGNFNGENVADILSLARAGIGASVNNKIAERALEAEKPFLQDVTESHRSVYGDYRSKIQGEKAAAQLRSLASKPLTSDGAIQQKMMMDAQIKGQDYIDAGNTKDDAMMRQTGEVAWQQNKENQQQRQAAAMQNRQAMLMTSKNKAQIENARDSANYSQIINPLLTASEQRLRNKAQEQNAYKEYFDDARIQSDVYKNFREGVSDSQAAMLTEYLSGGLEGLNKFIGEDEAKKKDWLAVQQLMNDEIIRRKAELKGVTLNNSYYGTPTAPSMWSSPGIDWRKSGGTIYRAKLTKRAKDNDRTARSIESSKKIAARFLEKAMDSLYTYDQVELIAKPKKSKRKYQAGGGLPFVGFTPVFATSERGANTVTPETKKDKDSKGDLTSKDILELLKDMDGLPSDMQLIMSSLQNFSMQDKMDPLGLSSSSDIASRYMSLINKIKVAKFNREEYNQAFNQLKGNGGLTEFAITSEGMLIGTNKDGDFEYFTPEDAVKGKHSEKGYQLLTNSNLLHLRANSVNAAFNHKLTTVAQNGIGINTVTNLINNAVTSLGSTSSSTEGYAYTKQGELIKGLDDFYKAAQASGGNFDGTINDLYKGKYLTKTQAEEAKKAIQYVYSILPENAKALLKIKSDGSEAGALKLIETLITSKETKQTQFDVDLVGGKSHSTASKSSGKDGTDLKTSLPLNVLKNVGGVDTYLDIDRGDGIHMSVRGTQFNLITSPNGESISDTSLSTMLQQSGLQSIVKDMRNIQFGDQKISPEALSFITYNNTGVTRANLPVKPDGTVNLTLLEAYEKAERDIDMSGDKSPENIKSVYEQYGITSLLNADGTYNQSKFAPFMVTEGYTTDALSGIKESDFVVEYKGNIDAAVALMQKSLAVGKGNKVVTPEVDEFSWYNPADWFGWTDTVFKGVVYIPITNNVNTAVFGANQSLDYDEAMAQEEKYQNFEKMSNQRSTDASLLNI